MKKIGILGGLSSESTVKYYQWLNEGVQKRLGGHNSARILLSSFNFDEFVTMKEKEDWESQAKILSNEALVLEKAGADFIIVASNTMHRMANEIERAITVPFLHLADVTSEKIISQNIKKVGFLGTRYTMEMDFYQERFKAHGLDIILPDLKQRNEVNRIIYDELCLGQIKSESKEIYISFMNDLVEKGAEGIILGCTEITLLIKKSDIDVPTFDTTKIHVEASLDYMLN